jgi:carbon monoxide dehydrogenase subunit G
MPAVHREADVPVAPDAVWRFVRRLDNWAPLLPGYERHVERDESSFWWQVRGESGPFSRLLELDVNVSSWNEPEDVRFDLQALNEPFGGSGRFATARRDGRTQLTFELELNAKGAMAPMVNTLIASYLDGSATTFLDNVVTRIAQQASGREADAAERLRGQRGAIVVTYTAPRSREFEAWLHGPHYDDLLRQPQVRSVRRLEPVDATGDRAFYMALIESDDLGATLAYRNGAGRPAQAEADERGLERLESHVMRVVYDRRVGLLPRLRRRFALGGRR